MGSEPPFFRPGSAVAPFIGGGGGGGGIGGLLTAIGGGGGGDRSCVNSEDFPSTVGIGGGISSGFSSPRIILPC